MKKDKNKPENNQKQVINKDLDKSSKADLHANSAYSGSGSMQPGGNSGETNTPKEGTDNPVTDL